MRRKAHKNYRRSGAGKVIAGMLVGGVVGATAGWLTAPASDEETRRRLRGDIAGARQKAKSALENVESKARGLAAKSHQMERLP